MEYLLFLDINTKETSNEKPSSSNVGSSCKESKNPTTDSSTFAPHAVPTQERSTENVKTKETSSLNIGSSCKESENSISALSTSVPNAIVTQEAFTENANTVEPSLPNVGSACKESAKLTTTHLSTSMTDAVVTQQSSTKNVITTEDDQDIDLDDSLKRMLLEPFDKGPQTNAELQKLTSKDDEAVTYKGIKY